MTTENKTASTDAEKSETQPETKAENTASDNKRVFAPLGKYAIFAVIMVSIIVTSAIMLDKEMNTVEDKIAVIENAVTDTQKQDDTVAVETVSEVPASTEEKAETTESPVDNATASAETPPVVNETVAETVAPESVSTEVPATTENTQAQTTDATVLVAQTEAADASPASKDTVSASEEPADGDQQANYEARMNELNVEKKQRMTETFARINTLEAKQLEAYKAEQDEQVKRLQEQLAEQQKMIDMWVQRNKEMYELRAAKLQRYQESRSEMLNRI